MASTMYGFQCMPCLIVGWPDTDHCPQCGRGTSKAEVEVSTDGWRELRDFIKQGRHEFAVLNLTPREDA